MLQMDVLEAVFKDNIIHRPDTNHFEDDLSLGHLIIKSLTEAGDKIMMIDGITGETLSANQIISRSTKIAESLLVAGIKLGDIVSIVSENRFEYVYIFFGTIFLNCTLAPLNPTYNEKEIEHALNLSKPKYVFASDSTIRKVSNVVKALSYVNKLILIDDINIVGEGITLLRDFTHPKLLQNINLQPQSVDKKKSICVIVCSSGTTGLPKGVQLTQANMIVSIRHWFLSKKTDLDYEVVILGLLPLYHVYGCEILISVMATIPGRIILLQKFEEQTFLSCIEKYRCSNLYVVPPLMVFLSKNEKVEEYDLSCVRSIHCGAAPLSKETEDAVRNRLKNVNMEITQGYGMSELTSGVLSQKNIVKPGSVGDVNFGVYAKVIDDKGHALGPNKLGELCFKGNRVMAGYIGNKEATSEIIDTDGWLHSGDIGYYDDDLQFYIIDRIKELIKWKGFQVPPAEIEALLLTHPKILDCGVIGRPDETVGELPMAFVVPLDTSLCEKDVVDFVNQNASPAKKLRGGVIFVDHIPKNPSGKILRRELRELLMRNTRKSKL